MVGGGDVNWHTASGNHVVGSTQADHVHPPGLGNSIPDPRQIGLHTRLLKESHQDVIGSTSHNSPKLETPKGPSTEEWKNTTSE